MSMLLEAGSEGRAVIYHLAIQRAVKGETITREAIEADLVSYGYATPDDMPDDDDWREAIWPWIDDAQRTRYAILDSLPGSSHDVALAALWVARAMQSVAMGEHDPRRMFDSDC